MTMTLYSKRTTTQLQFDGCLAGLNAGSLQSRGLLEIVSLHRDGTLSRTSRRGASCHDFATPSVALKLVEVPSYGTMVLRNTSPDKRLIVPMHVGFFQHGAQNHATSQVLVFEAGETSRVSDCFCIQAAQGGLLKKAEQRFVMLPAGLRPLALAKRGVNEFGRLWDEIDGYTRSFGVARGGHLERFLRPYFPRLLPFRHAFEPTAGQVGAAYFVAGKLAGVEVGPSEEFFHDLFPILAIYCYGPSALLAERHGAETANESLELDGMHGLDDLAARLHASRDAQAAHRGEQVRELAAQRWNSQLEEDRHGLRTATVTADGWMGQVVRNNEQVVYVSVFRA